MLAGKLAPTAGGVLLDDRIVYDTDGLPEIVLQPSLLRRVFGRQCSPQKPLRTSFN